MLTALLICAAVCIVFGVLGVVLCAAGQAPPKSEGLSCLGGLLVLLSIAAFAGGITLGVWKLLVLLNGDTV